MAIRGFPAGLCNVVLPERQVFGRFSCGSGGFRARLGGEVVSPRSERIPVCKAAARIDAGDEQLMKITADRAQPGHRAVIGRTCRLARDQHRPGVVQGNRGCVPRCVFVGAADRFQETSDRCSRGSHGCALGTARVRQDTRYACDRGEATACEDEQCCVPPIQMLGCKAGSDGASQSEHVGAGRPMRSALHKKVAHVATNTTVAIPKRPNGCDQAPRSTAQASPMAIAANTKARLLYGRPAPYSAVKAPIEATNPAGTSPTPQPKATGAATQNAAPREYGQRFGAMLTRTRCRSRKDAGREGGGKGSIYITEGWVVG